MRRLVVICFVVLASGRGTPAVQDAGLAGVWRFEQEVDRRADGSIAAYAPEHGYEGMLILTADGFMSGTLMPKGRTWTVGTASFAELHETVEMGTAYSGPYTVDQSTRTMTIDVVTSIDPSDVGKRLTRHYVLGNGSLILSGAWTNTAEPFQFAITFTRIK